MQLLAEIKIHKSLQHRYIVGFQSYFEDRANVYIMLELCGSQVRVVGALREGGRLFEWARAVIARGGVCFACARAD